MVLDLHLFGDGFHGALEVITLLHALVEDNNHQRIEITFVQGKVHDAPMRSLIIAHLELQASFLVIFIHLQEFKLRRYISNPNPIKHDLHCFVDAPLTHMQGKYIWSQKLLITSEQVTW